MPQADFCRPHGEVIISRDLCGRSGHKLSSGGLVDKRIAWVFCGALLVALLLASPSAAGGDCKKTKTGLCENYGECWPPRSGRCRDVLEHGEWDCRCTNNYSEQDPRGTDSRTSEPQESQSQPAHSDGPNIDIGITVGGYHREHGHHRSDHRNRDKRHEGKSDGKNDDHDKSDDSNDDDHHDNAPSPAPQE